MSAFATTVGSEAPIYIAADASEPKEVTNTAGGTVYHKAAHDVDSGDTALTKGSSVELTAGAYFISASKSELRVRELDNQDVGDNMTVAGDLAVAGDATVTGAATVDGKFHAAGEAEIDGDINHDGTKVGFFGTAPQARPKKKAPAEVTAKELAEALETLGLLEH